MLGLSFSLNSILIKKQCQKTSPLAAVASFTKEVNPRLAQRPLVFNERLANHGLTSLVKEATVRAVTN